MSLLCRPSPRLPAPGVAGAFWVGKPEMQALSAKHEEAVRLFLGQAEEISNVVAYRRAIVAGSVIRAKTYTRSLRRADRYCALSHRLPTTVGSSARVEVEQFVQLNLCSGDRVSLVIVRPLVEEPSFFSTWQIPDATPVWERANDILRRGGLFPQGVQVDLLASDAQRCVALPLNCILHKCALTPLANHKAMLVTIVNAVEEA